MYGGCVRPILGDTQTQCSCFCLYIRLFCLQKIAVIAAILQKMTFCTIAKIAAILQDVREKSPTGTGFLAADLFAVDFNSAQCAELKNLDSLPSTYLRGGLWWVCGGFAYKPTTQTVSFARCFLYTFLFLWWVWCVLHKKST